MEDRISFLLSVSADEAVERIGSLPEIQKKEYVMEQSRRGVLIWQHRAKPRREDHEHTRIELRITLWTRGTGTRVAARVVQRPKVKPVASVTGATPPDMEEAVSLLYDLLRDVRESRARWHNESRELLNLVSRALMPVSLGEDETGPYRE